MKILQTINGMSTQSGGPSTCTLDLVSFLNKITDVELITFDPPHGKTLIGNGEKWLKTISRDDILGPIVYSQKMSSEIRNTLFDIAHTNGLWYHINHATCKIARDKNKPYVITPHGMLFPDALRRSLWKKYPLLKIWFEKDIKKASCLHATSKAEFEAFRKFGYNGPIALIPNPMPPIQQIKDIEEHHEMRKIGYLGRLHPVKRVDVLIKAWQMLGDKVENAELCLIGSGTPEYEKYLHDLADKCKYGKISFRGFLNGFEKYNELSSLRALCLVSSFENFGMSVTEALSVGTPIIANLTTPWEDLNDYNCGWWIDASVENIAMCIEKALSLTIDQIDKMGANGKKLVQEKYAADKVAEMMFNLYKWLVYGGDKPAFVLVNE